MVVGYLVGGWFASPVIKSVLEKAKKYLGANYELHQGAQGLVETLTIKLEVCQAIVIEVEKQPIVNNSALANWLGRLKQTAYDAEDVIDNMEAKAIKVKVQGKSKVSNFASSSISSLKNLFFPDDNHNNLKKVVDQLNQLSTENQTFLTLVNQNKNNESCDRGITVQRETISQPLGEVGLYGRDEQLNLILEIILDSPIESSKKGTTSYHPYPGVLVLSIVGMGGVGKTALAQAVYNNPDVQRTFESKAWISVARNFNVIMLMRMLIQSLGGYLNLDVHTKELTSKNLSSIIDGVRFLVVLDDIFEKTEDDWAVLFTTLSRAAPGSVVLITTQNQNFANRVSTSSLHIALDPFELTKFWELFKQYAFRNLDISEERRKTLEQIGKQIAVKLRGLPLAAKVVGNLLHSNVDEDRWRKLSKNEWWDMDDSKSQILPSIGVNYENLNPSLRQCFTFCSVFPRNSLLEKDRLVQMWIAHNFIHPNDTTRRLEDVGRQWFDKLVEFSFLEPTGDKKGYVMPSLMHDLAIIVSSNESFYLTDESDEIPQNIRHLAVETKNMEVLQRIQMHKKLRTFLYFGFSHVKGIYGAINETLHNLDKLRILDLSYLHMETKIPPAAIQNQQHLRFLDLSSTGIEVLSHTSFDHYHLQSLHIKKCQFSELPRGISKLVNLRHLNADAETVALISGIGKLTNLQELNVYCVGKQEGRKISELKNLREITGQLRISNCENIEIKDLMKGAKLADKKHLDSVEIFWSSERRKSNMDIEILEGLKPHRDINKLNVKNYTGQSFPNWMMEISHFLNLQEVRLDYLNKVEVLPPLGELPSLKYLRLEALRSIKTIDYNLYGNRQTVFPALTEFYLSYLSVATWTGEQNREFFPHLSSLEIHSCFELREVPLHSFGASLKTLKVNRCFVLNSLEYSLYYLNCLTKMSIFDLELSTSLNIRDLRSLEHLTLSNCANMSIQGDMQSLANLKELTVRNCPTLLATYQPKGKGLQVHGREGLQSLTYLLMDHSILHREFDVILGRLPSLRVLECQNSQLNQLTSYQISWFQDLTNLRELTFYDCEYEHFPFSLAMMLSLQKLTLSSCAKLESLANCVTPFLWELTLSGCSENLVKRCQPNEGEDWPLISHVPLIRIDGKIIHRSQTSEGASG